MKHWVGSILKSTYFLFFYFSLKLQLFEERFMLYASNYWNAVVSQVNNFWKAKNFLLCTNSLFVSDIIMKLNKWTNTPCFTYPPEICCGTRSHASLKGLSWQACCCWGCWPAFLWLPFNLPFLSSPNSATILWTCSTSKRSWSIPISLSI